MKSISKLITRIVAVIILSMFLCLSNSCKKEWLDVNYNPSELTDSSATPDLILPSLLVGDGAWYGLRGTMDIDLRLFNSWMGYWSNSNMPTESNQSTTYNIVTDFWGSQSSPVIYYNLLEEKASRTNQTFYVAIAKVMKALTYSRNVDIYNNLPYSEAFKVNIRQPKYDSGEFIYEDLLKQLSTAIDLIKNAQLDKNIRLSKADLMYKGDKGKWIKFSNTLKLRLLIHQANRQERTAYIKAEIEKIVQEGSGFLNSGESAEVNPGYFNQKPNRFFQDYSKYSIYGYPGSFSAASANVIALNRLKENNDPRIGFFYSPVDRPLPANASEPFSQPAPLNFRGNQFGLPIDESAYPFQGTAYVSQIGGITSDGPVTPSSTGIIKGYNMGMWIMTSIESLFLQAEAIHRGWLPGNPEQAYLAAVKESFRWLNVGGDSGRPELSDAVFQMWYDQQVASNNPNVSWAAAPDKYKLLMFQKYMAFNGIEPFEAYVDYRRNGGYPNIPLSADPSRISNKMPIRSLYDAREYINNAENVRAQGNIDVFNSKIWWMP